jgi:hypothetical protein
MIGSSMAPRVVERLGTTRVVSAGLVVLALILASYSLLTPDTSYWLVLAALLVMTLGMGAIMAPSTDAVMGAVPRAKAGVASATNDVARQVSGAIGVAIVGSALNSAYAARMADAVTQLPAEAAAAARNSIGAAIGIASNLPGEAGSQLMNAARHAFVDSMGMAVFIGAGAALIGAFLVARYMPPQHLPEEEPDDYRTIESEPALD